MSVTRSPSIGGRMDLDSARRFMFRQAEVYAERVRKRQINASCVETLISADADHAGDQPYISESLHCLGMEHYAQCLVLSQEAVQK